jgi:hypothetical protein
MLSSIFPRTGLRLKSLPGANGQLTIPRCTPYCKRHLGNFEGEYIRVNKPMQASELEATKAFVSSLYSTSADRMSDKMTQLRDYLWQEVLVKKPSRRKFPSIIAAAEQVYEEWLPVELAGSVLERRLYYGLFISYLMPTLHVSFEGDHGDNWIGLDHRKAGPCRRAAGRVPHGHSHRQAGEERVRRQSELGLIAGVLPYLAVLTCTNTPH